MLSITLTIIKTHQLKSDHNPYLERDVGTYKIICCKKAICKQFYHNVVRSHLEICSREGFG